MNKYIQVPIKKSDIENLKTGNSVMISGTIYVARDAAHKRMQEMLDAKQKLPFELENNLDNSSNNAIASFLRFKFASDKNNTIPES